MGETSQDAMAGKGAGVGVASGLGNGNFGSAAAILLLTAAGWSFVGDAMELVTMKSPVPWAAFVEVNDKFVMTTMEDSFGPFEFVSADGEIDFDNEKREFRKDGRPDGEADSDIQEDVMDSLGIGTSTDEGNLPLRCSNWLTVRIYRDSRKPEGHPLRYWRLEVYYYTGGTDLAPHVPEICMQASGAEWDGTTPMPVSVEYSDDAWGKNPLKIQRALFHSVNSQDQVEDFVQYYIFSLNGLPATDRTEVRLALGSLFVKHAYFAKIQFAPVTPVVKTSRGFIRMMPTPNQADDAATEFVEYFMPYVLKMLPMPSDVARLDAGEGKGQQGS